MSQRPPPASKRKHKKRQGPNGKKAPAVLAAPKTSTPLNPLQEVATTLSPTLSPTLVKRPPPASHALDRYDLDIMIVAYNVHAMIKHTPLVEDNIERAKLYLYIDNFVKNKPHFENILIDAQRKRNIEALTAQGVLWFEKTVSVGEDDIYKWSLVEDE